MTIRWAPPVGNPLKSGMCRHYDDPETCRACRIHDEEIRRIQGEAAKPKTWVKKP